MQVNVTGGKNFYSFRIREEDCRLEVIADKKGRHIRYLRNNVAYWGGDIRPEENEAESLRNALNNKLREG